ncbi:MAG: acetolactate synthase AlsS [Companilactobacillus sp.]|jgi:acetolactate synthase-1/2/3 large subunit|nr:acetolactate synthase AlsS [Companilactobacillus sp.]MCH4009987.1 acetolactate synthase AlsS [Companilactobacillus sp.]MCH4052337.1 acetolactate synthase AlsS [Companilactobacillus sp.]MCH4077929.1 acetolactate synthase AlsS [Companilactobacillus sp.]MCH4126505.1 acetolactate synthase AlsS [Companilactobacillus sp.]MCH4132091.1 acetolactate synthase AlsS [Companilactobacillus sp.]
MAKKTGADALFESMINQGIKYVFGLPGAKVDKLFDLMQYSNNPKAPKLIITRHEQNAAFIASGIGRLTGKPGVVATTSGPGVSNLATGLITATSEGDPVVALGGQVPRNDVARLTHQSIPSKELLSTATKDSVEVQDSNNISETFANAYQTAMAPKSGATFVSLPKDVLDDEVTTETIKPLTPIKQGGADQETIDKIIAKLKKAKLPVILAGMRSSDQAVTESIQNFLNQFSIPVVETFQGAGVINRDLERNYYGRVGLFRNQIGDAILKESDLVIAIGYDPVEYEARLWNVDRTGEIINLDSIAPEISNEYQPELVVQADIAKTLNQLSKDLPDISLNDDMKQHLHQMQDNFLSKDAVPERKSAKGVHPLEIIHTLQNQVNDDTTVTVDVGSHYIWMARHFRSYKPRHLLFSNGMQTLGVALPWAIAAALERPDQPVVSVAGDGGFLFSGQELETAVRLNLNIVQLVWNDGYYDMVKFQEEAKYGRNSGVDIGSVDFAKYAESFGATGIHINKADELEGALKMAFAKQGPTVIDIPVDYSDNIKLLSTLLDDYVN